MRQQPKAKTNQNFDLSNPTFPYSFFSHKDFPLGKSNPCGVIGALRGVPARRGSEQRSASEGETSPFVYPFNFIPIFTKPFLDPLHSALRQAQGPYPITTLQDDTVVKEIPGQAGNDNDASCFWISFSSLWLSANMAASSSVSVFIWALNSSAVIST